MRKTTERDCSDRGSGQIHHHLEGSIPSGRGANYRQLGGQSRNQFQFEDVGSGSQLVEEPFGFLVQVTVAESILWLLLFWCAGLCVGRLSTDYLPRPSDQQSAYQSSHP